jgi:hypothetical protein
MEAKEHILNETAKSIMTNWDIDKFKTSHPTLYKTIVQSMDRYAMFELQKVGFSKADIKSAEERLKEVLEESSQYIDLVCKSNKLTREQAILRLREFTEIQQSLDKNYNDLQDYKKHFLNWLRVVSKQTPTSTVKSQSKLL